MSTLKAPRKSVALRLAEHFGSDVAEMREYDYHSGHYVPKVYLGMDGNRYWSAGPRPPKYKGAADPDLTWRRVDPTDTRIGTLWVGEAVEVVS